MTIEEKMRMTVELAKKALSEDEMPISAIVFLGDEVVSSAYTSEKVDKRFLVHAEMKALIEADIKRYSIKDRKKMQLFTTLEPCMMCLGAAMTFFIGEIYFSLEAPMDGAVNYAKEFWNKECKEIPSYNLPKIQCGTYRKDVQQLFRKYATKNEGNPMYSFAKTLADL